jgi:hypothetical protein
MEETPMTIQEIALNSGSDQRKRFERYAAVMGWDTQRLEDGYYLNLQMNDDWALWMACIEFESDGVEITL